MVFSDANNKIFKKMKGVDSQRSEEEKKTTKTHKMLIIAACWYVWCQILFIMFDIAYCSLRSISHTVHCVLCHILSLHNLSELSIFTGSVLHTAYFIWCQSSSGSRDSLSVECWTCDRMVASSDPSRNGWKIFFSTVNFVCWLLFSVHSMPMLPL